MNTDSNLDLQAAISPDTVKPQLAKLQQFALIAAALGVALCVVGYLNSPSQFFQSYLLAYLYWFGITAGCIGFLMLHNTVGGGWGFIIRRLLEAGSRTLPYMAVLFLPIAYTVFMGNQSIYEWVHDSAAGDKIIQEKAAFLNVPGFLIRSALYFAIWGVFTFLLNKWSRVLDERNDPAVLQKLNVVGAGGLLFHVLLVTFMSVDWVMSLTPHWVSSMFGLMFVAGQALTTLAFMNVINGTIGRTHPLAKLIPDRYFRDLGNLMLALILVWSYCSFSQYLIQYSGNLAEEVGWYSARASGGWGIIGISLVFLHFAIPFLFLLSSSMKTNPGSTAKIAAFILLMRFVDLLFLTRPTFSPTLLGGLYISDIGAFLLLGGIWLWLWAEQVKKRPLVPIHDPRFSQNWAIDQHGHGHDDDAHHDISGDSAAGNTAVGSTPGLAHNAVAVEGNHV